MVEKILKVNPIYYQDVDFNITRVLCQKSWLFEIVATERIPATFPVNESWTKSEVASSLKGNDPIDDQWIKIDTLKLPFQDEQGGTITKKVYHQLSAASLPESLHHITLCNLTNLIRDAKKKYSKSFGCNKRNNHFDPSFDLLSSIQSFYPDVPLIDIRTCEFQKEKRCRLSPEEMPFSSEEYDSIKYTGLLHAYAIIVSDSNILCLFKHIKDTLSSVTMYSPGFLNDSAVKKHFIAFQLVRIFKQFQDNNIYIGDVSLQDFHITATLHVHLKPYLSFLGLIRQDDDVIQSSSSQGHEKEAEKSTRNVDCSSVMESYHDQSRNMTFSHVFGQWTMGNITNLEYVLFLNKMSGRRWGDPNFHPIVPWVTDFTSQKGNFRDLTKSKFRLNKGDEALDRTFESGDHHVTAVLSEITYYTYKARQTERSVLTRYVRPNWVPGEYPRSIQRLQQWSPDEAIPELYLDPNIFRTIHDDLPDMELPDWTQTPEDFIVWHRQLLESDNVSSHLHSWIDLNFGYKLSGPAALRNKNVCLDFSDKNKNLKQSGVVQLFGHPHPPRRINKCFWDPFITLHKVSSEKIIDDSEELEDDHLSTSQIGTDEFKGDCDLNFPTEFVPGNEVSSLEAEQQFLIKNKKHFAPIAGPDSCHVLNFHKYRVKTRSMNVLGLLILELFLPKQFRCLGQALCIQDRYLSAVNTLLRDPKSLPHSIRFILCRLLLDGDGNKFDFHIGDHFPVISESGLPLPSATQILDPILSGHFPEEFKLIRQALALNSIITEAKELYRNNPDAYASLLEFEVKQIARSVSPALHVSSESIDLLIPLYLELFASIEIGVQACWYLFNEAALALRPRNTNKYFLSALLELFRNSSLPHRTKLYHRSFILVLITRLTLGVFLENFTILLIEELGGHRYHASLPTYSDVSTDEDKENFSVKDDNFQSIGCKEETDIFLFDSFDLKTNGSTSNLDSSLISSVAQNLKLDDSDRIDILASVTFNCHSEEEKAKVGVSTSSPEYYKIEVCKDTLMWLAARLGPVLTSKYITRNLLKMTNLCFLPSEGLEPTDRYFKDQKIRLSPHMLSGDCQCSAVLECLVNIAELYGDQFVLVQYLPYCLDLVEQCKRKLSVSLEGGLIGCLSILHSIIPLLSDSVIMKEIDSIVSQTLRPIINTATSSQNVFSSGAAVRLALIFKTLDTTFLIGLRIGEEMARVHLSDIMVVFFSAFNKVFDASCKSLQEDDEDNVAHLDLSLCFTKELAYTVYIAFYFLFGGNHLDQVIPNIDLIKKICLEYQSTLTAPVVRPYSFRELQASVPSVNAETSFSGSGNMIVVDSQHKDCNDPETDLTTEMIDMICLPSRDSARHLRGSWLAYWEHEVGKSDTELFTLKQIRLQSWIGHQGSVRSLAVLDNENSFLSGGKDKTVRVWSLRNTGEGDYVSSSQWLYNSHKKSVFSVGFMQNRGLAVSCDGILHVWDPFVGAILGEYEASRNGSFCVMKPLYFSNTIVCANTDGNISLIDSRCASVIDVRVSLGIAGIVRSLCCSEDAGSLAVGHSSGYVSLVDLRTGKLRSGFKAHDGEVLTLTSGSTLSSHDYFVSTSLDQTASTWFFEEGKRWISLRAPQEPLHCAATFGNQIITGSTSQKLLLHNLPPVSSKDVNMPVSQDPQSQVQTSVSKLRPEIVKGNLTQVEVLPLNNALLIGTDMGNIHLIC